MAPFRAPREAHERPRRIWTDSEAQERIQQQNLRALEARRLAIPPLFNPYPRGIKLMSEREADEVARHGEVLRWSSDSDEDKAKDNDSDSEEPTEFGVVWERVHHQEAVQLHKNGPMVGDNKLDRSPVGETNDPSEASEFPSPHLADFELFLDNMTKQTKAAAPVVPNGNIEQYNEVPITARDQRRRRMSEGKQVNYPLTIVLESEPQEAIALSDPVVPNIVGAGEAVRSRRRINTLSEGKRHVDSESDDDDVPITKMLSKPPKILPTPSVPKGNDAIGLIVARDFGADGGIYHGRITAVDMEGRRIHYHVTYDDGDEEDFDYEELKYAVELQQSVALGTYKPVEESQDEASDGEGSLHDPSNNSDGESSDDIAPIVKKGVTKKKNSLRKRKADATTLDAAANISKKTRKTKAPPASRKEAPKMKHTSESVLLAFSAETEYGQSFRCLESIEQKKEVERLNKGAVKGTKEVIKSKLITQKYKQIVADKMRDFLIKQRQPVSTMFRATPPSRPMALMSPTFISVGEWVEVDADRTPGWNSEGGVGVIIAVHDAVADVKCVFFKLIFK